MHLIKHKNHRDSKYLSWLRTRSCVASGDKADVAHHVRLGTNGGKGIKPSDYFCVPLTNELHTTGSSAIHLIGEASFIKQFKLNVNHLFIKQLSEYLNESLGVEVKCSTSSELGTIACLISLIEEHSPASVSKAPKKRVKKSDDTSQKIKLSETEFYQKAKELKRQKDKEIRDSLKKAPAPKVSVTQSEFYQKAKELKKQKDKELRDSLKLKKTPAIKSSYSDAQLKAKEDKKMRDREYRKEQYRKMKELKKKQ